MILTFIFQNHFLLKAILLGQNLMSHVMKKSVYANYANNKEADQSAHPRILISVLVVCSLDSCYTQNFKT